MASDVCQFLPTDAREMGLVGATAGASTSAGVLEGLNIPPDVLVSIMERHVVPPDVLTSVVYWLDKCPDHPMQTLDGRGIQSFNFQLNLSCV